MRRRRELNPQNPVVGLAAFKAAEPSGLLVASVGNTERLCNLGTNRVVHNGGLETD